jgi:cell division control protein 45
LTSLLDRQPAHPGHCSCSDRQYEPESDSEEEYEDTDDEDLNWRARQRKLLADSDDESSSSHSGDENDPDSDSSRGKRRRLDENGNEIANGPTDPKHRLPKRMSRRKKQLHINRIKKYYAAGTSYGQSVAGQVYVLATLLRRADNDYLWCVVA